MNRTQALLLAARWYAPHVMWSVTTDGRIVNYNLEHEEFTLSNPSTLTAVETKLHRELGWKIYQVTRNGKPHYEARGGERGKPDHPDRVTLILQLIPGHRGASE